MAFLSVALSKTGCIFPFSPPSSPSNSFPTLLIHLAFLLYSLCPIFCSKIVLFPYHPVGDTCQCIHPQFAGRSFSLFWNVLFCLYCFILFRYHFYLPSFTIYYCYYHYYYHFDSLISYLKF